MKIFYLFFSLYLSASIGFSQEIRTEYFNSKWKPTRKEKASFFRRIKYDASGHPIGTVRDYYITGELQWVGKVISVNPPINDSICTWYYKNGQVQEIVSFKAGKREGEFISYYEDGKLQGKAFYSDDKLEGESITFYNNSQVQTWANYTKENKNGEYIVYWQNGTFKLRCFYINNLLAGDYIENFPNGSIERKSYYTNNLMEGEHIVFHSNGKLRIKANFKAGNPEGDYLEYFPDGSVQNSGKYKSGKKIGEHLTYSSPGKIAIRARYDLSGNPEFMERRNDANELSEWFIKDGKGIKITYSYGEKQFRYLAKYEYPSGLRVDSSWHRNRQLAKIVKYNKDVETFNIEYNPDGELIYQFPPDSSKVHLVKDNAACLYGFKNLKQQFVLKPQFTIAYPFKKGYAMVASNEKYGLVNEKGRLTIPLQYDKIEYINYAQRRDSVYIEDFERKDILKDFFRVRLNKKYGVVKFNNKTIIPAEYDQINNPAWGYFIIQKNGLFGIADTTGVRVKPSYHYLSDLFSPNYMFFRNREGKNLGVMNIKGAIILPDEFDNILLKEQNVFWVKKNQLWGLYDYRGEKILDTLYTFDQNKSPSLMGDSTVVLNQKNLFGIYHLSKKWILPCKYSILNRVEGFIIAGKEGKLGVYDNNGKPVIPEKYSKINIVNATGSDHLRYFIVKENNACFVLNSQGKSAFSEGYDYIGVNDQKSLLLVKNKKMTGCRITNEGLSIVEISKVIEFNGKKMATVCPEGNCVLINEDGDILPTPKGEVLQVGNIAIIIDEQGKYGVINEEGKVLMEAKYSEISVSESNDNYLIIKTTDSKYGLMDQTGKLIAKPVYDAISQYVPELDGVWVKEKIEKPIDEESTNTTLDNWGVIDKNGKYLLAPGYRCPVEFKDSVAIIAQKEGVGVLDINGKMLIPFQHQNIYPYNDSLFVLRKNGKYGLAGKNGKIINNCSWDGLTCLMGGHALFFEGIQQGIIDSVGNIVMPLKEPGFTKTNFNIARYIKFIETRTDNDDEEQIVELELKDVIPGYEKITKIKSVKLRRAISNLLVTTKAKMYALTSEYENGPKITPLPITYDQGKWGEYFEVEGGGYSEDIELSLEVINQGTFSIIKRVSECYAGVVGGGGGHCQYHTYYENYAISGDSIRALKLEDLFSPVKNYYPKLNNLVVQKIRQLDNPNIDCSNPESILSGMAEQFLISTKGLVFYLPSENSTYEEEESVIRIVINYNSIKDIINPGGPLKEFVE